MRVCVYVCVRVCVLVCVCEFIECEGEKESSERKMNTNKKRNTEGIIINVFTAGKLVTVPVVVENIKNTLIPC